MGQLVGPALKTFPLGNFSSDTTIAQLLRSLDSLYFGPSAPSVPVDPPLADAARTSIINRYNIYKSLQSCEPHPIDISIPPNLRQTFQKTSLTTSPPRDIQAPSNTQISPNNHNTIACDYIDLLSTQDISDCIGESKPPILHAAPPHRARAGAPPSTDEPRQRGCPTHIDASRLSIPPPPRQVMPQDTLLSLLSDDIRRAVHDNAHQLFFTPMTNALNTRALRKENPALFKHHVSELPNHYPRVLEACHAAKMLTWTVMQEETEEHRRLRSHSTLSSFAVVKDEKHDRLISWPNSKTRSALRRQTLTCPRPMPGRDLRSMQQTYQHFTWT